MARQSDNDAQDELVEGAEDLSDEAQRYLNQMPEEVAEYIVGLYKDEVEEQFKEFKDEDFDLHTWLIEQTRADYFKKRASASNLRISSAERFEKAILNFSVGGIALSLTFLQVIEVQPKSTWQLIVSWIGFGIAVLIMLSHLILTQHAMADQMNSLDDQYKNYVSKNVNEEGIYDLEEEYKNDWEKWTNISYWISITSFTVGVLMFAWFSFENLP